MANMSYCRFQNTAQDLRDCIDHIDEELSEDEQRARIRLARLCTAFLRSAGIEISDAQLNSAIEEIQAWQ